MKRVVLLIFSLLLTYGIHAQEVYTVDGEEYVLKLDVDGVLDLLWNGFDGEFRYFVRKDGQISELLNTRGEDGKYQQQYKGLLAELTKGSNLSTDKTKFTLYSLRQFVLDYNSQVDPNFQIEDEKAGLQTRMLLFGGLTNSPFVTNPGNDLNALVGIEFEVTKNIDRPRHAILFQARNTFESSDFPYSIFELGLGYRFRFVSQPKFNLFVTVIGATYSFRTSDFEVDGEVIGISGSGLDAPIIFGIGSDIRLGEKSFLTLVYDELIAISIENQGNFPTHFAIGYKLIL